MSFDLTFPRSLSTPFLDDAERPSKAGVPPLLYASFRVETPFYYLLCQRPFFFP